MARFVPWGPFHLAIILSTFAVPLALAWWSRRAASGARSRGIARGFAALLLLQLVGNLVFVGAVTKSGWQEFMPLHLCHLALFAVAAACLTRSQLMFDISYFWGLAGTVQGLLTPGLQFGFPSLDCVFFFAGHSGIISAVIFLAAALGLRPRWRSVGRAYLAILGYAVLAGSFNAMFGTNYGFLREKPSTASLLDVLGPWPWYIVSMAAAAAVGFILLYLPWAAYDRRRVLTPARTDG